MDSQKTAPVKLRHKLRVNVNLRNRKPSDFDLARHLSIFSIDLPLNYPIDIIKWIYINVWYIFLKYLQLEYYAWNK